MVDLADPTVDKDFWKQAFIASLPVAESIFARRPRSEFEEEWNTSNEATLVVELATTMADKMLKEWDEVRR